MTHAFYYNMTGMNDESEQNTGTELVHLTFGVAYIVMPIHSRVLEEVSVNKLSSFSRSLRNFKVWFD